MYCSCRVNTYGWDPAAPEKKGAQRLRVNYNSASSSITDPEMPLQPLQINQDNHIALLNKATGSTNTMHSDGQRKPGTDRRQSTAEKDRKRVDSVTQKGPQLLLLVPRAMTRFHSLFTLPLDSSEPPTQSTAGTRRRFLAMGRVLTTVPAPTKDFKW